MKPMTRNLGTFASVLMLGSLLVACQNDGGTVSTGSTPVVSPAWELRDMDGTKVSSAQFAGKVLVVDFWATWCPPCRQEIPGFIALQQEYGPQGLVVIGVDVGPEDPKVVKQFMKKMGINYPVVAGDEKIAHAFGGVEALPTTFVIDRNGKIISKHVGFAPKATFESEIKALLR